MFEPFSKRCSMAENLSFAKASFLFLKSSISSPWSVCINLYEYSTMIPRCSFLAISRAHLSALIEDSEKSMGQSILPSMDERHDNSVLNVAFLYAFGQDENQRQN